LAAKRVRSLLALAAVIAAVIATPASAALRHIDGTVVSKSAKDHSFKLSTQSGTLRIRVDSTTVFERISGFGALRQGSWPSRSRPRAAVATTTAVTTTGVAAPTTGRTTPDR
jgi:hypothetical protein